MDYLRLGPGHNQTMQAFQHPKKGGFRHMQEGDFRDIQVKAVSDLGLTYAWAWTWEFDMPSMLLREPNEHANTYDVCAGELECLLEHLKLRVCPSRGAVEIDH
jgi:hypothetical protein